MANQMAIIMQSWNDVSWLVVLVSLLISNIQSNVLKSEALHLFLLQTYISYKHYSVNVYALSQAINLPLVCFKGM